MNQPKLNPSEADLIASIEEAKRYRKAILNREDDTIGWHRRDKILEFIGLHKSSGSKYINQAVKDGRLEAKQFIIKIGNSGQRVWLYRLPEEDEITRPY